MELRQTSYDGNWYLKDKQELEMQLSLWNQSIKLDYPQISRVKAIIAPHNGFSQSGIVQAHSYRLFANNQPQSIKIFVIAPLHYIYSQFCCVPQTKVYQSPFGPIKLDLEIINELKKNNLFQEIDKDCDEEQYSIELQLPHIAFNFQNHDYSIVPIYMGNLNSEQIDEFVKVIKKYFEQDDCLFVFSCNMTYWGNKYNLTFLDPDHKDISKFILELDETIMSKLVIYDEQGFKEAISKYQNILYGKSVYYVFIRLMNVFQNTTYLHSSQTYYKQSNIVKDMNDNTVTFGSFITYYRSDTY